MQYPSREAEILRLANDLAAGLAAHTEVFPATPFSPEELQQALAEHGGNREATIQARAAAAQSTADKDGSLASTPLTMEAPVVPAGWPVTLSTVASTSPRTLSSAPPIAFFSFWNACCMTLLSSSSSSGDSPNGSQKLIGSPPANP